MNRSQRRNPKKQPNQITQRLVHPRLAEAIGEYQSGNLENAERICRQIASDHPSDTESLHLLGIIAYQTGRIAIAIDFARQAVRIKPDVPAFHNNLGSMLQAAGDLRNAVASYKQALALKPNYVEALNNLGYALGEQASYEEAISCFERALELNPAFAEAHNNLGNVLKALAQLQDATACYEKALVLKPNYSEVHNNLGVILVEQGKLEDAAERFEKALALNPNYVDALNNLGTVLLELNGLERAEMLFKKALQLRPEHAETFNNVGSALYLKGDFDNAIHSFVKAIERRPRYPDPVANLGRTLTDLGKYGEAFDSLIAYLDSATRIASLDLLIVEPVQVARLPDIGASILILLWLQGQWGKGGQYADDFLQLRKLKSTRKNKISLVFLNYLAALFSFYREKPSFYAAVEAEHGVNTLTVIGESHSLSPANLCVQWEGEKSVCKTIFIMGVKMWHLAKPEVSRHRMALERQLKGMPHKSRVLLTIGEIDCRIDEGIWHVHTKKKIPIDQLVKDTTNGYLDWVEHAFKQIAPASITIQGIPAPAYSLAALNEDDQRQFLRMIREVNIALMHGAITRGWSFLDVYGATANENGLSNGRWHLDNNHLRPDFYVQVKDWVVTSVAGGVPSVTKKALEQAISFSESANLDSRSLVREIGNVNGSSRFAQNGGNATAGTESAQLYNRGNALLREGRLTDAIALYDEALELDPNNLNAVFNRGLVFYDLGQTSKAIEAFQRVLALRPDFVNALIALGHALLDEGCPYQARTAFSRARALDPDNPVHWLNDAKVFLDIGRPEDAMSANRKAVELRLGDRQYWSNLMLARQYSPIDEPIPYDASPWALSQEVLPVCVEATSPLRIGFVSGDLCRHPVGLLLLPLLSAIDRNRFEIFCYSAGTRVDEITNRLKSHCQWRDVRALTDHELRQQIISDQIVILFDLAGYTRANRLEVFAQRAAPIQIAWLGYTDTTAVKAMDFVLMDQWHVPSGDDARYSEKVLRLPNSRFLFGPPEFALPVAKVPSLSRHYITFGSFNNTAKLNSRVIALWAEILNSVRDSRLVLKWRTFNDQDFCRDIHARFEAHGIDSSRVELRPWSAPDELLKQYADIDIALDPFPFSGGYTTFEALWMGVPVITLAGKRPISRQGLCLLSNIDLQEFVAGDEAEYARIATGLAHNGERLSDLRSSLREMLSGSPLFDVPKYIRNFEALMNELIQNQQVRFTQNDLGASIKKESHIPTFLHVGCGPKRKDQTTRGFNSSNWRELRLDIDEAVQPDIVGTMLDMSAVGNECVDAIYSSHNIEHLYPHEVPMALKEFLRVLKPEGFLVLTCPDLQSVAQLIVEDKLAEPAYVAPAGPITPIDILYGHRPQLEKGNLYMAHKCGFTLKVLIATLTASGFQTVAGKARGRAPHYDLWVVASKAVMSQEQMMRLVEDHLP